MGQKTNPIGARLGIIRGWESNWYGNKRDFSTKLIEDNKIRTYLNARINKGGIAKIVIERTLNKLIVTIHTSKPGIIIGKGGGEVDRIKEELKKLTGKDDVQINILEIRHEEFLNGIELSVFILTDGKDYVILPEAKDYKRIGDGDIGPNTGGMGAVSPVVFADTAFMNKIEELIVKPTILGLNKERIDYKGFIFAGIMNVGGNPYVIEYNARMGDPETQAVMPRIKSDFVELLVATAKGKLKDKKIEIYDHFTVTVALVSGGYPGEYETGKIIHGLENAQATVFHAGTLKRSDHVLTHGGRVLSISGKGKSLSEAREHAYKTAAQINWEGLYFRRDIGQDLLNYKG